MTETIVGYQVFSRPAEECVQQVFDALEPSSGCTWLGCLNPHSYALSLSDPSFMKALLDADWLVPDGIGVVLASRLKGGQVRDRVTGSDIFQGLQQKLNDCGDKSIFFLGSTNKTLSLLCEKAALEYPNVKIAGTYSPPFKPTYSAEEVHHMIEVINAARPDVLWVGMTAPKQEKWIFENRHRLNVKFAGAVGAVFDFYTDQVKRSPRFFQRIGLEWLPRLLKEPRRLWRRTFISGPIFFLHVFRQKIARRNV